MSKIGCIIQARMGSTRLPGKAMLNVEDQKPVLYFVIKQIQECKLIDKIIVATTTNEEDNQIANYSKNLGIDFFRGSSENVLDRHYQCAKEYSISTIVRIPSDKPLIDPQIVDSMTKLFIDNNFDYLANFEITQKNNSSVFNSTYPSGTEVEVFSFDALELAWKDAKTADEREHVTPYLYSNPDKFKIKNIQQSKDLSHYRWSLDYENDMYLIREIIKRISSRPILMDDIIQLLEDNYELYRINKTKIES